MRSWQWGVARGGPRDENGGVVFAFLGVRCEKSLDCVSPHSFSSASHRRRRQVSLLPRSGVWWRTDGADCSCRVANGAGMQGRDCILRPMGGTVMQKFRDPRVSSWVACCSVQAAPKLRMQAYSACATWQHGQAPQNRRDLISLVQKHNRTNY